MNKQIIILISGNVQGVSFRYATLQIANELRLTGFVQNLIDGSVKILAEGEKENLDKLIVFAKNGPKLANVREIKIKFEKATGKFTDFEIRY